MTKYKRQCKSPFYSKLTDLLFVYKSRGHSKIHKYWLVNIMPGAEFNLPHLILQFLARWNYVWENYREFSRFLIAGTFDLPRVCPILNVLLLFFFSVYIRVLSYIMLALKRLKRRNHISLDSLGKKKLNCVGSGVPAIIITIWPPLTRLMVT